ASEPDGAATPKRIWLSEFGWTVDQVSPSQQAAFLTASYDTFAQMHNVARRVLVHPPGLPRRALRPLRRRRPRPDAPPPELRGVHQCCREVSAVTERDVRVEYDPEI